MIEHNTIKFNARKLNIVILQKDCYETEDGNYIEIPHGEISKMTNYMDKYLLEYPLETQVKYIEQVMRKLEKEFIEQYKQDWWKENEPDR